MSIVRPFAALRPPADKAASVSCPPYDVVNSAEAARYAKGNPLSFFHVSRPEIDLAGVDEHDDAVYDRAPVNLATFKAEGGDESAKEFADATAAMENALLTQTQARDYAKKLLALVGKEIETEPPVTEPDTPAETDPPEDPTDEPKPGKKGCGSAIGLSTLLTIGGAALLIRKKREE